MKTAKQLKEERGEKLDALNAITTGAESRSLNPEEITQFDTLENEIRGLDAEIARAETAEKRAAEAAGKTQPLGKESNEDKRNKDLDKFSVLKLIRSRIPDLHQPLDGIEKEMSEEAAKELGASQHTLRGLGIPSMILQRQNMVERRDNSVTMPTQPEDGAAVVQTEKRISMEDMLRKALVTRALGATVFTDLVGNVEFVRMKTRPKATFKAEVQALDKSNIKFGPIGSLSPNRIGTFIIQSLQFLKQTSPDIEAKCRQELIYSIAEGIDIAAIFGSGTNNEPLGVYNDPSVTFLALGTNGAELNRANLINLETALMERDLRNPQPKWLFNARTRGKLKNTSIGTAGEVFVMEDNDTLLEYPVVMSNMVPSDVTKGTGTNLSSIIFGDWKDLYISTWGAYELLVNPYTYATVGQVEISIQAFADTLVYRPESFTGYKDVKNAQV
jgi:HK97 family phage major capsid protein